MFSIIQITMEETLTENDSWLHRFFPKSFDDFLGYTNQIEQASEWIRSFLPNSSSPPTKNSLLITGQPGTGKTAFAYTLISTYGFQMMETTALDSRTSEEVRNKLEHVLGDESITVMTKKPKKTAVIMDEIDASDKQECPIKDLMHFIHFAKHDYEYRWRVHIRTTKKKVTEAEIKKKMRDGHFPNKNPMILIANHVSYSLKSILKDVIHIHLELPTLEQLTHTMKRISTEINMPMSELMMNTMVPYCQQDYRRAINIMNDVWNRFYNETQITKYTENDILSFIKTSSPKDVEIPIEDTIHVIFDNSGLNIDQVMQYHESEEEYLPTLIYENYIQQLETRYKDESYEKKLANAIDAYEWILSGARIRYNEFGKEGVDTYPGYFTSYATYVTFHQLGNADTQSTSDRDVSNQYIMDKSKMSSKYKYRFCQFRPLYHIARKLRISIHEIPILSHMILNAFFIQTDRKAFFMELLSKSQMNYEEVEKLFRSSMYFIQSIHQLYTKKKEKDLENEYKEYMKKNTYGYDDPDD